MRTLIIRVFDPAPDTAPPGLCGVVEDVRTGSTRRFRGDAQLTAIIRALGLSPDPAAAHHPETPE